MLGCMSINRNMWKTSVEWLRPVIQMTDLTIAFAFALGPQIVKPFLTVNCQTAGWNLVVHGVVFC